VKQKKPKWVKRMESGLPPKNRWIHYGKRIGHYICICGKKVPAVFGHSHGAFDSFGVTEYKEDVTCPRCIEILERNNHE
jgi:hypothetical protein